MENKMMVITESAPTVGYETQPAPINQFQPYPAYDEKQMGKLIDEVIAAAKDDRMNTNGLYPQTLRQLHGCRIRTNVLLKPVSANCAERISQKSVGRRCLK